MERNETRIRSKERSYIQVFFIYIPVGVHLSSPLFIVRDQLLVNLAAVLHADQRVLLVTLPHHKQDHYD